MAIALIQNSVAAPTRHGFLREASTQQAQQIPKKAGSQSGQSRGYQGSEAVWDTVALALVPHGEAADQGQKEARGWGS